MWLSVGTNVPLKKICAYDKEGKKYAPVYFKVGFIVLTQLRKLEYNKRY
jgi:hypothetical protein